MQKKRFKFIQRKIKMARQGKMRLKVDGVDDILKALEKADQELQNELHNIVAEAIEIVFKEADATVPIGKTHKTRDSLKIETGFNNSGIFYANVVVGGGDAFYVSFYELGNSRQPPRPFLRPALDKSKSEIRDYMVKRLQEVISRQGK